MKLNIPVILAAVSLATATPLRVVVTSHQEVTTGDVTSHNVVAQVFPPPAGAPGFQRKPCHKDQTGNSMIEKGRVWIMGIMGHGPAVNHAALPDVIEPSAEFMKHHRKPEHIDPVHLDMGAEAVSPTVDEAAAEDSDSMRVHYDASGELEGKHHRRPHGEFTPVHIMHMGHRHRRGSFLRRMHFALMALGPWEGRAVAFVLGCGIGVLLRMFFVLSVVIFRAARGSSPSEPETEDFYAGESLPVIVFDADNMPPAYSEKLPFLVDDEKPKEQPEQVQEGTTQA